MASGSDKVQRVIAGVMLGGLVVYGCSERAPTRSSGSATSAFEYARVAMGSSLELTIWTGDEGRARQAAEQVFAEFDRLERLMSTWVADSDVSRANRAAGSGAIAVSPEVREVLGTARQISEWTGGKFDVTFGPLSGLWKFDHDQDDGIPDMRDVRRRLPLIDYRAIQIEESPGTVAVSRAGMSIHLGGIGKGYAIDRAAALLRHQGIGDFMIQSGGDLYVAGTRGGQPWRIGVQDPRGAATQHFAELDLSEAAVSTSGDYERFFVRDGQRYHHLLDPSTGEPARGSRSVTIVSSRSVIADGLSTGVFVMGPREGIKLVERLPDVEGVIVTEKNEVLISSGLRKTLRFIAPPTP